MFVFNNTLASTRPHRSTDSYCYERRPGEEGAQQEDEENPARQWAEKRKSVQAASARTRLPGYVGRLDVSPLLTAGKAFLRITVATVRRQRVRAGAVLTVQGCSAPPQPPARTAAISGGTEADQMSL